MRELGDHAETAHRMIGSKLADLRPDLLVTVGQSSLWIAETAVGAGYKGQVEHFSESRDAAEFIVSVVLPNDIVLVKGSRALQMEKIVEQLV
ncbi:MAG: UDP-N-acetylmuramoyl-tripeptide--D-alanyl-D-alanine ligase, partial [Armatimonadota bacterium]